MQGLFTHIIVGAGSAGCVIAARVAENKEFDVLLIEAGKDYSQLSSATLERIRDARRVPMKGQSDTFDESIDWNLVVDLPDKNSLTVPQARLIGGGSSINGGTALRNTELDVAEWINLGNDSWKFRDVLETYDLMEDDALRGTSGYHPIIRTEVHEAGSIQKAFIETGIECGFRLIPDLNETGAEGIGSSPVCRQKNTRVSAANTYIDPIRSKNNFTLLTGKMVDRVTFSQTRATGVVLDTGETVLASREVIVSAGAIYSPALLQRSGVGEAELLNTLAIPQVAEVPVGQNLSDHPCVPVVARPKDGSYANDDYSLQMQARWSSKSKPGAIDLQMVCFSYLYAQPSTSQVQTRGLGGDAEGHVSGIGCNVNKPTSLGHVKIRSRDSSIQPVVRPEYLETDIDRAMAREVVRKAFKMLTSRRMQEVLHEPIGLTSAVIDGDELLDAWIKSQYTSTFHFCGSCRMASQDKGGVVDQEGCVYGVQGLRVCDASIIPTVPAANTMWTTMMFAERIGISIRDGRRIVRDLGTYH